MLIQRYSKTTNLTGHGTYIPRFLPQNLARTLLKYLTFVRPLECAFVESFPEDAGEAASTFGDYRQFLFCSNGKRMDEQAIRDTLASTMKKNGLNLTVRSYRHVSIAFARHHLKLSKHILEQLPFDEQASHSEETGTTRYGFGSSDSLWDTAEREHEFFLVSYAWQILLQSQ